MEIIRGDSAFRCYLRNDGRTKPDPSGVVAPSAAVVSSSSLDAVPSSSPPIDAVSSVQENEQKHPLTATPTEATSTTEDNRSPTTATPQHQIPAEDRSGDVPGTSFYPFAGLTMKEARQRWFSQNTDGSDFSQKAKHSPKFFHLPNAHVLARQSWIKGSCPYHDQPYCRDCEYVGRRAIATASTTPIDYVFELLHARKMLHGLKCSDPPAPVWTLSEILHRHCVVGMDVLKLDVEGSDVAILRELCGNHFASLGLLGLPRKIIFEARREFGAEALEMV